MYHDYNVALFSQIDAVYGAEKLHQIIRGLHENLARTPLGSDRDQAKGIFEGKCDVGLLNTYYYPLMKEDPEQHAWAEAVDVFYPNQKDQGALVMRSALGLTKATKNAALATDLLEFFASEAGQKLIAKLTYQFTTNPAVPPNAVLKTLGTDQPEVKNGNFKMNLVPLNLAVEKREEVLKMLNEVSFDQH